MSQKCPHCGRPQIISRQSYLNHLVKDHYHMSPERMEGEADELFPPSKTVTIDGVEHEVRCPISVCDLCLGCAFYDGALGPCPEGLCDNPNVIFVRKEEGNAR